MATDTQAKPKVESKPIVENKTDAESGKKPGKRWILIGSIALAVIVAGLALWAIPHFRGSGKSSADASKQEIHNVKEEEVKATLALDPFLVNLADKEESRFVKATFQLGLAEEMKEEGKETVSTAAMRDSIITLLTSKTSEQILTSQGKDKLREEIRARINAVAPKMKVSEVYIVDFVVQL